ncbi:MAG TPA: hypothetical protein DCX03_00300 [Bacteroidales bacterium]|jgi:hypothetical protein|nr:hypothetical protein [Bacteroidales bacterium]
MIVAFRQVVKDSFFVVHQRRVKSDGKPEWDTRYQEVKATEDIIEMFSKVHMTADEHVAVSEWWYPNDTKYRFSLQVLL